jgi:nitrate reductase gamma subunit
MQHASDYLHQFLFGIYPYIALTVLFVGSWIRFDREPYTWRSGSSELLRHKSLVIGSNLWHVGVLVVLCGHFVGLLTPLSWYELLGFTMQQHQLLAIFAGGIFGTLAWIGLTILMIRRFGDKRILRTSSVSDLYVVVLLWLQLSIGLTTLPISWGERHDPVDTMMVAQWAQHILTFRSGAAELVADVRLDIRVHMVLGMTILGTLLPFTRLVHIWSAPIWYLFRRYQIVRTRFHPSAVQSSSSLGGRFSDTVGRM